MAKLIQKSGFIKSGGAAGYMKYIATREGVEKLHGRDPATVQQQQLIAKLLSDYPDSDELFEYEDYLASPTFGNASAFISMALDANVHALKSGDGYMKYIATRPRVERRGDHGLFGSAPAVDLNGAMRELEQHQGKVWTLIYSLRREDAARLGYDNADSWRGLLMQHQAALADAMKIPVEKFRWYAAFHDEATHPHIHMMVWSDDPKQGWLTKAGIAAMRSKLTNTIFRDELENLYQRKDISYKALVKESKAVMQRLVEQMTLSVCDSPAIEQKLAELSKKLENVTGKKQYGYLRKPLKELVDSIVDELAKQPEVAECYEAWNEIRDELEGYYKQSRREHLPLSMQKEFRAIKNIVIREAENIRLGTFTFEDDGMRDEPEPEPTTGPGSRSVYRQAESYRQAKDVLNDPDLPREEKLDAVSELEQLWEEGYTVAAHLLGKVWRDGTQLPQDMEKAELWFRRSADAGNDYSQYALGKLLTELGRTDEGIGWLTKAAEQGYQFAQYRLGKIYLTGELAEKDVGKAVWYLTAAAEQRNQFAQYALGKLYLQGRDVPADREAAVYWLTQAAEQGNQYAQFFLERMDTLHSPSLMLGATRLLHHLGNIFRQNSVPPSNPQGIRIDSKRRKKLMEKKMAMGHKADDHEPQQQYQQQMTM